MNDSFENLAGLGAIKAWLKEHLPFFREGGSLAPRAIVLTGLPGTGKHSVSEPSPPPSAGHCGRSPVPMPSTRQASSSSMTSAGSISR